MGNHVSCDVVPLGELGTGHALPREVVVVTNRDAERALREVLSDHVLVEMGLDRARRERKVGDGIVQPRMLPRDAAAAGWLARQ